MSCWTDAVAYSSLRTEQTGVQHRAVYNHLTRAVHVLPEGQRLTELENQAEGQQQ